jgi:hypothetical protein
MNNEQYLSFLDPYFYSLKDSSWKINYCGTMIVSTGRPTSVWKSWTLWIIHFSNEALL